MTTGSPTPWTEGLPARLRAWPQERQCLIHLLRSALNPHAPAPVGRESVAGLNLPRLIQLILRHRVGAFLAARLPVEVIHAFPPQFGRRLDAIAQQTRLRALRQTAALVRWSEALSEAGVAAAGLKGALLAERLYGGQGIRHAGDIDFSIVEADVAKVDALLCALGCRRVHPACAMTVRRWQAYTRVWRDSEYRDDTAELTVEIMWRLANSDGLQASVERITSVPGKLAGREIPMLPDTLHGLYLLVHGAHHGWFRLFWLLDIALLMREETVDWAAMRELAERTGTARHFWQGLHLAREIFAVAWPRGLAMPEPDDALQELVADACWHMELAPQEIRFGAAHVRMAAYARRLMPDPAVRRRERSKRWISPDNWALVSLPDRLFSLYTWLWPVLWAWRQVARRWRGRRENPAQG